MPTMKSKGILLGLVCMLYFQFDALNSATTSYTNYQEQYQYSFKVAGVTSVDQVKPLMDYIGGIFGQRPSFNDHTDFFYVVSAFDISEDELVLRMGKAEYSISNYTKNLVATSPNHE